MRSLLEKVRGGHSCTAAFVASDIQALGALEIAREQGVAVPGDLALIVSMTSSSRNTPISQRCVSP